VGFDASAMAFLENFLLRLILMLSGRLGGFRRGCLTKRAAAGLHVILDDYIRGGDRRKLRPAV